VSILLDVLDEAESDTLLDRLVPRGTVAPAVREEILAAGDGNPLFIEQLLAAALGGEAEAVPDSIQTLLAARLDRLDEDDRAVAQAAAVCGTSFATEDVAELVGADPSRSLLTLVRRELVRPGEADDPTGAGWSFRHSLIRDVAYGSLTKRRRAELHERLAQRAVESDRDVDLTAGYHLELAARARREAGEQGADVDRLAARAAWHLGRAGRDAYDHHDMAGAASLLGRANALLAREDPERVELALHLAGALVSLGEVASAAQLLGEAAAVAAMLGDPRLVARVTLSADLTLLLTDAAVPTERLFTDLEACVPVLEEAGDDASLAIAEALRFQAHDHAGLSAPPEGFSRALEYARRAGARHLEHYVMGWTCITLHRGAVPVDEAIARATAIHGASTSTYVRTSAVGAIGVLRAMKGEFDEARRCVAEVKATLEELGLRQAAAAHSIAVAEVEALAGDDVAAERILRAGLEELTTLGDEHSRINVAWRLALALAHQGRYDEADGFVRLVERSEHRGFWIDVWWRVVLALVEARRSDPARVRELVDQGLARVPTDEPSGMQADALLESAAALRAAGLEEEATVLLAKAADTAAGLGYVVAQRRADEAQRALTA
jgi:hypothetical protein